MLRRLYPDQPEAFAFTPANQAWAEAQITKYPDGRQASAIIPLLWRAQEQEGWLTRPAIEHVAEMLDLAYIRALEVASFYFMFQLQPVGSVAHIQICGTTSCMICGAEDLVAVCKEKIAPKPHQLSADGTLSWEEVECLGACANAPMAQIGKDYFEDLTAESFTQILEEIAAGKVPTPGSRIGRFASEPSGGVTSLAAFVVPDIPANASVQLATDIGDTIKRIDGTEVPLVAPWQGEAANADAAPAVADTVTAAPAQTVDAPRVKSRLLPGQEELSARKGTWTYQPPVVEERAPETLAAARESGADNLTLIKGVGPKLAQTLNTLGFYHFDQIAAWSEAEVAWVDTRLKFKGRIQRDAWIAQARILAAGGETEFSTRAQKGDTTED